MKLLQLLDWEKAMNNISKLNSKQEQAIQLLASGTSVTQVANKVEVDRVTVYRWMNDREFKRELNKVIETYTSTLFFQAISELESILQTGRDVDKLKCIEIILGLNGKNIGKNGNNINFVNVETPEVSIDDLLKELEGL